MTITAAILCGGQGTRLQSVIGPDLPKCLAPVAGRPFLSYVLDDLPLIDCFHAVLCTGRGSDRVKKTYLGDKEDSTFSGFYKNKESNQDTLITCWPENNQLGTAAAVADALPHLDSHHVLVMNGDTLLTGINDHDVNKMRKRAGKKRAVMGIGDDVISGEIRPNGIVILPLIKVVEMAGCLTGCSHLYPTIKDYIDDWCLIDVYYNGEFLDIGTPEGYARAESFLREQGAICD